MLSKLLKMQVLEDDDELAYGGDETPGTERKDIEVRKLYCTELVGSHIVSFLY